MQKEKSQSTQNILNYEPSDAKPNLNNKNTFTGVWLETLNLLEKKLNKPSFETWIKGINFHTLDEHKVILEVKNDFTRNFLLQSYKTEIENSLKEVLARTVSVHIQINSDISNETFTNTSSEPEQISLARVEPKIKTQIIAKHDIKPELNFSNFAALDCNNTALVFSKALLNSDFNYQSLLIFAEPGLGKSHLLHAIANEHLEKDSRVKLLSAEKFTNSLISSIQRNKTQEFRDKHRNIDLLLLDDFEFIDNKKTCQEELLYTIRAITNNGGKVVIASSKAIEDFKLLNNKLKSFLQGSLYAQIQKPSFQSRLKLVSSICKQKSISTTEAIEENIARKFTENIREIEGALLQISAMQKFSEADIDSFAIANVFGSSLSYNNEKQASIESITEAVSQYFGLEAKELIGKSRLSDIVKARHIAIFLSHEILEISHGRIGKYFGSRKHSSVIHSIKVVRSQLSTTLPSAKALEKIIDDIRNQLKL